MGTLVCCLYPIDAVSANKAPISLLTASECAINTYLKAALPTRQTKANKSTENHILPSRCTWAKLFCELLIVRGLSVCCLAAAVPHLGDFRSNLSGACPSISLSTLSITVQHCQGNRERERGDGQQPIPCSGADNNYLAWHSGGWSMTDLQQTKNTFGRFPPLNRTLKRQSCCCVTRLKMCRTILRFQEQSGWPRIVDHSCLDGHLNIKRTALPESLFPF